MTFIEFVITLFFKNFNFLYKGVKKNKYFKKDFNMILDDFLKVFEIDTEIDIKTDLQNKFEFHGLIYELLDSKNFKKVKNLFVINVKLLVKFESEQGMDIQKPAIFIEISDSEECNGYFELLEKIKNAH
jgi:hypothetical protein